MFKFLSLQRKNETQYLVIGYKVNDTVSKLVMKIDGQDTDKTGIKSRNKESSSFSKDKTIMSQKLSYA